MMTFISDRRHNDPEGAARIMAEGTRLLVAMGALFCGAAAAALVALYGASPAANVYSGLAWLMIVSVAGKQMYMSFFAAAGGIQRMDLLAACNIVFPIAMLGSSIGMVYAVKIYWPGNQTAGILAGAGGVAVASVAQCFVSLAMFRRADLSLKKVFSWRIGWGESKRLLSFGWVAALAVIAASGVQFLPPAVVSFVAHSAVFGGAAADKILNAGRFCGAFTYAMAPMLLIGMVMAIVPAISEAESKKNPELMQRYFDLAVKYALSIIMLMVSIYAVYAGTIVELFSGKEYPRQSMGILTLTLFAGMSAGMLTMLVVNVLVGIKKPAVPAAVSLAMTAAVVAALAAAGVYSDSVITAAGAFSATVFMGLAALLYCLKRLGGIKWPWKMVARPAAAAVAAAAALRALPYDSVSLFSVAAACVCGLVFYLVALGLAGGIDSDDFDMARDTFRSSGAGIAVPAIDAMEKFFRLSPLFVRPRAIPAEIPEHREGQ
jgi:O-antigen/teichoic acid export membrane protein